MRLPLLSAAFALACAPAVADTAGLTVDHAGIACLVADRHPVIRARVAPEEQVARARVYFRGGGQPRWYYVDMVAADGQFRGTLPKPTLRLKTVEYYVDGLGRALAEARSANHEPRVVRDEASCTGEAALPLAQARVVVGGAADGAPVPEGFSADGVVGAPAAPAKEGRLSGNTIGLGLAGLAAVGGAIAAAGGGDASEPAAGPAPSTGASSPSASAPGATTLTFSANLFGPGWHRGDCSRPQDLAAQFTPRASGRAEMSLAFTPRPEHFLSLQVAPEIPVAGGNPQGPGPVVTASYAVQASTTYTVRVCVPVGPPLDPGPMAVTLTITHP